MKFRLCGSMTNQKIIRIATVQKTEKEVKKEVALHECEKMLFPPENELTESPYSQRVMKMTEREFTADDADVIKDIEYLRYIQEQEQIDAELEAQREEDEEMTA